MKSISVHEFTRLTQNVRDLYLNGLRKEAAWNNYKYEDHRLEVKVHEKSKGRLQGLRGLPGPDN